MQTCCVVVVTDSVVVEIDTDDDDGAVELVEELPDSPEVVEPDDVELGAVVVVVTAAKHALISILTFTGKYLLFESV